MTVRAIVPVIEYTGNGVITKFDWDWDMIDDSSIHVTVDDTVVDSDWSEEDQSVVFSTAPADGAVIIIYRRTIIWMPEDYVAFGRFYGPKTELSLDRATLIAQERMGDAINNEPPSGIVGGSNLSITRGEFDVTVNSERGTDAVVPMYDPDGVAPTPPPDPDPNIIWAGDAVLFGIYSLAGNTSGVEATIRFKMDLIDGDPTEASAFYPNYNATAYLGWLDADPNDDEYWMRVRLPSAVVPPNLIVSDGTYPQALNTPFKIRGQVVSPIGTIIDREGEIIVDRAGNPILPRGETLVTNTFGPYISVHTFGDIPPIVRFAQIFVDICKDDGTGLPDGGWATRPLIMEAIFNA